MPEKDADKDIKYYVLPKRKKQVMIPTEDGEVFRFELERPNTKDRDGLLEAHGLYNSNANDKFEGKDKITKYMNDVILLICKSATKQVGGATPTDINLKDEIKNGTLDDALYDLLGLECQDMLGITERDRYFRSTRNYAELTASVH
jgi:hypothetical protein